MSTHAEKQTTVVITACMKGNGLPVFALSEVAVVQEEMGNGVHYYLAEADLLARGFEEPMVHFEQQEMPASLFATIRRHLEAGPDSAQKPNLACEPCL